MKIISVRLQNYKSIQDTGELAIGDILVLAGKNNAGKTALIEGIFKSLNGTLTNPKDPVFQSGDTTQKGTCTCEFTISLEKAEQSIVFNGIPDGLWSNQFRIVLKYSNTRTVPLSINSINNTIAFTWIDKGPGASYYEYRVCYPNGNSIRQSNMGINLNAEPVVKFLITTLIEKVVYINGNRTVPDEQLVGLFGTGLTGNISNLHAVLLDLHNNRETVFDQLHQKFSLVFPDINNIVTRVLTTGVTNIEFELNDVEKRVRLQDCGSGYTHVLTLLYVLYAEQDSKLVLFDEPQSFLHPSAEKAVYDQVAAQNKHQFIFTTHSPILINYPMSKNLCLVSKISGNSKFVTLAEVQNIYEDLGINNSDFALSDKVLFVEGPTEKRVIPKILSHFEIPLVGHNYSIVNIKGTGDEFRKDSLMVRNAAMYEELFKTISVTPIEYRILLDRDEKKKAAIEKTYGDKVILLQRRELENYFLIPEGIQHVLQNILGENIEVTDLEKKLQECLDKTDDKKLYPDRTRTSGIKDIVGSEVLEEIFSKYHVDYSKPSHGEVFVDWIIKNKPEQLREIFDTINPLFAG